MEAQYVEGDKSQEAYKRLRNCVELDFKWLNKINAKGRDDTEILGAIELLSKQQLLDVSDLNILHGKFWVHSLNSKMNIYNDDSEACR